MKNSKKEVHHYDKNNQRYTNEPLKKFYDNEFAEEYDMENRPLQLQKDQNNVYTKSNIKTNTKSQKSKKSNNKNC